MAKTSLGLDIGSFSVKIVEIDVEDARRKLKSYAIVDIYGEGEEYDAEGASYNRLSTALKNCFRQAKVAPKRLKTLNCGLGGTSVAVKQIRSIPLSPEELESSLAFEARKHLPLDDTEAILDFQIVDGGAETSFMDILLVATTKKAFDTELKLLADFGAKPRIIDANCTALVNSYLLTKGKPQGEGALVFLDIGAKASNLTIFTDKNIIFSRDIPIGGYKITEDIKTLRKVEYDEAEDIKKQRGMGALLGDDTEEGTGIRVARRMAVDGLIDEIRRSLRYYTKETGVREFDRILLSGGSAMMPNLNSHMAQALNMTVEIYNPFDMFITPPGFDEQVGAQLAIACGLALRED
jgi:type IV pilus assembly protein PilM